MIFRSHVLNVRLLDAGATKISPFMPVFESVTFSQFSCLEGKSFEGSYSGFSSSVLASPWMDFVNTDAA